MMKIPVSLFTNRCLVFFPAIAMTAIGLVLADSARAGLTLEMNVIRYDLSGYYFYPNLTTNGAAPDVTFGDYFITSSGQPTNGSSAIYRFDSNGFNQIGGGSWGYGDFASMKRELTNGLWSLFVTNTVTTNVYRFAVTASITSNDLPYVAISSPQDGAVNVTNRPTFTWQGPTNYNNLVVYYFNSGDVLPVTQTSLLSGRVLYDGPNSLTVHYDSNSTTVVVASVPTNSASQPVAGWVSTVHLQDYSTAQFTVGMPNTSGTAHTLVAHYPFDADSGAVLDAAVDTSGNGYDMSFGGGYGADGGTSLSSDSAAGLGAVQFHNGDGNSAGYLGWSDPTPPALLSTLAGSFSISCWIKTSQSYAWDEAPAEYGAGIVSADASGLARDTIPLAITGSKVGFNTGGDSEDVTLNSSAYINDGNYHHIVVTRNQATGQKYIYVDGVLDRFSSGSTESLGDPQKLTIGALADAWNSDPDDFSYHNGYDGLLDDLQVYSGVLSASEVADLYANPGSTSADGGGGGASGGHTNLAYYTFEDNNLFAQDFSGHGNNIRSYAWYTQPPYITNNAVSGDYALGLNSSGWIFPKTNLVSLFARSFSVSVWLRTSDVHGNNSDGEFSAAGIVSAFSGDVDHSVLPMGLTGSKLAFYTGGATHNLLKSQADINTGQYVHLAVTRDQSSGEKKIYINGVLDSSAFGSTESLNGSDPDELAIGNNNGQVFNGSMDEVQFYSGVLSADEVAFLYNNPGTNVADVAAGSSSFADALETSNLTWTTGGDANWFVENSITHDGVDAAQSGAIGDDESTWIETTVAGPGTLSFWWNVDSDDFNSYDFLEFDVDGNYESDIAGDWGWDSYELYLGPGTHTLTWTYFKDSSDSAGADAGYLDQVSFVPDSAVPTPTLTVQPLDQTNYPGYTAALLADATNAASLSWQWYKAGSGLISGATNKYYAATNSGTPSVAGSYFVIATGLNGSTTSRTAVVAFANAPTPPDWSAAFRAQLYGIDNQQATTNYGIACLLDSSEAVIYTANSFTGTNIFASDTLISGSNRFAAGLFKHYTNGAALWGRAITNAGNGNSYPQCLATGPGDGVYMSGVFLGTNKLGDIPLEETAGASLFLVRFDAAGNIIWVRTFGGTNSQFQSYHQLVSDLAGNVTISALGDKFVDFGTTNIVLDGQKGVLAQYDLNGNIRWIQKPSGWVQYMAYSAGRIYVAFEGSPTNYIGGLTNLSDRKWALAALNATNGQAVWIRGVGSAQGQGSPSGINFDVPQISISGSNVFLTGNGWGSNAVFGAYSVSWPELNGQYFARYDTNGNEQLAVPFGGTRVAPWAAKADAAGNVYVTGDFDGYAAFGNKIVGGPHYDDIGSGNFYGQTFLAKFDRNGSNIWVRLALSPVSCVSARDLALGSEAVWVDGLVNQYANFGAYPVYGTVTCIGFPFCTLSYHVGGYLAKVALEPYPVAADLRLEIYRSQNPALGEIFYAFPYFNSVSPAATGTTTNVVLSPTGKFHGEINASGNKPFSIDLFSFDQLLNEITNGQWTLYFNKGLPNERQFHFSASATGFTSNLLSAVKIVTPTNGATGVPTNSPFIWTGPTNFGTLDVNKQKFDGTEQSSVVLPVTATNWPSPPVLSVGTNRFSVTYTSNNFPGVTFTLPMDSNSFAPTNWAVQTKLQSTAYSIFVVSAGTSAPVILVNPNVTGTSFQFSFNSAAGVTNSIQYRTNLAAGTDWQTYTNVAGNGSLQTIQVPVSVFSPAPQGFIRIVTQ